MIMLSQKIKRSILDCGAFPSNSRALFAMTFLRGCVQGVEGFRVWGKDFKVCGLAGGFRV